MMQGIHHQQLAALLAVALPRGGSSCSFSAAPSSEEDEPSRVAAIVSLHHTIVYPPNSLTVAHSAAFLAQGFSQLLSDTSFTVQRSAVTAYGALCASVCSILLTSNGRQNRVILASLVDRFIAWALPLLSNGNAGKRTTELALEGLREFLNVGDAEGIERYALSILKACQELLEDERTILTLLHQFLGVLTLVSLKFPRCFQLHFVDIVDVLIGLVLVPGFAESDRQTIMDSFLQFQQHWVSNLQFSLGLLSKFLGDMDVLIQDGSSGNSEQLQRLLALLSCFLTVLQSTASGMKEVNMLERLTDPLSTMIPRLLGCLSMVGRQYGWSKWIEDLWRCLILLGEILSERFATFYPLALDILSESLKIHNASRLIGSTKITSLQHHRALKTNLQLLLLQKHCLFSSSVENLLQFDGPLSHSRLHPNHLVTGSSAATYIFLLQHENNEVVEQAVNCLLEEIQLLKGFLGKPVEGNGINCTVKSKPYSKLELIALVKFDLNVLLSCVSSGKVNGLIDQIDIATVSLRRSEKLIYWIIENLNPFGMPLQDYAELQANIIKILDRLAAVELFSSFSIRKQTGSKVNMDIASVKRLDEYNFVDGYSVAIIEHLRKYTKLLTQSLSISTPLLVKFEALEWIHRLCERIIILSSNINAEGDIFESHGYVGVIWNLVLSVLDAAFDMEPKVRSRVALIIELLLQARLIHLSHFHFLSEVLLEKLGDPDNNIRNTFLRLLSHVLPMTIYAHGLFDCETYSVSGLHLSRLSYGLHWKQVFALKQLPQQLHSPQFVSILGYVSQRWKVSLSSWVPRLINSCRCSKDILSGDGQREESGNSNTNNQWLDIRVEDDFLERICSSNNLAGAWWAIHEAARYCISVRLRTNLGGPTQTFAAVERMLLDVSDVLQPDAEQNDGHLNIIGSSSAHLLPMRLLLDFVEALKKNVYNAYNGSAVLPSSNWQSSLFFRANKKVCEEWFSRICEPMINAGLALQCHDATIHYCTLRLQDLKNAVSPALKDKCQPQDSDGLHKSRGRFSEDILRTLRHMALALCRNHEPEALIGLRDWASLVFSSLFFKENQNINCTEISGPFSWISGLAYQAEGRYEKAAAHFTHLLQTEELLHLMGSDGVQFTISRVIECFTAISDWKSLESWLLELQTLRSRHAGKSFSGALTTSGNEINAIHALARFDEGDFQAAWAFLDLTPKNSSELTLDPKLAMQRSEQMLLQAMLFQIDGKAEKVPHEVDRAMSMLEETLSILPLDGIAGAWLHAMQLHCILAFEGLKFNNGKDKLEKRPSLLRSYVKLMHSPINSARQDCNSWLKVLRVYRTIHPTSSVTSELSMNLLKLARKQGNLMLANRIKDYLGNQVSSCSEGSYYQWPISNLQYEGILLRHAENNIEDALTNLWSFLSPSVISSTILGAHAENHALKAKACLKLLKWLQPYISDMGSNSSVLKMQEGFIRGLSSVDTSLRKENLISNARTDLIVEELAGILTKVSCRLCPTMGKSWISYAFWCYNQATNLLSNPHGTVLRSCSFSSVLLPEVIPDGFHLTEEERLGVESVIRNFFKKKIDVRNLNQEGGKTIDSLEYSERLENEKFVKNMVLQLMNMIESAAGEPGMENPNGECLPLMLASQLRLFFSHAHVGLEEAELSSLVNGLLEIWWSLRKRRVALFGHAAHGFMQYLLLSSTKPSNEQLDRSDYKFKKQKERSHTLRAILYFLTILLNYGVELKDTLQPALSAIPLFPWQEITPQLFARLSSHPEQLVRKQLEGILMLLAKQSPWSIVYPTLVDVKAYEAEPSEELQHVHDCLNKLYPKLVQDVQLLISELENVTVLWEELWLSTLHDLHTDVMRRINLLKEKAARIVENATLSQGEKTKINAAKYMAMMAPIVVALERRLVSTSRNPETPHEKWFHETYRKQLKTAVSNFKTPPSSAAALGDVWRPFDNIAASLAAYLRKSSITLEEVAPKLALLSSSYVPMPGLEKKVILSDSDGFSNTNFQGTVTIASFSSQITILSTKTRPKKLMMLGSDGQNYTYLLKGREDLRLDARIMQLLQAIDGFLHSSSTTCCQSIGIRYYSVTPISGRAGLIQWVENVISVYSIFKSWQNRVQLAQLSATSTGKAKPSVVAPIPRPSDLFYGKIIPALKEKGIKRVISRRDWPHEVKRKVLLDLMDEVPRQLLHQELWCASEGFKAFSSKQKRYSGCLAAMSIVGHVLGLGDRHLDNVLLEFSSGDIVHIDYNVCFDKGQRLKVPEIVPFRLTQTIEAALGLTGIEGAFRANCEAVLGVLRTNKDILLMLLEVFVWDPLVEWTRGDFHDDAVVGGEERKGMELAVSLSLFASRVQEIRVPLQEHHDLLLETLPALGSALESFADVLDKYEHVSTLFYHADHERCNVILHEANAKSILADITRDSEKIRASFETQALEFAQAKADVAEKAQEGATWLEQHGKILSALQNNLVPDVMSCIKLSKTDTFSLTSAVAIAGVPLTIVPEPTLAQCNDIDKKVSQLIDDLNHGLSCAVNALQVYSLALQKILPLNYFTTSPVHGWLQILDLSENSLSSDILSQSKRQASELIAKPNEDCLDLVKRVHDDLCLRVEKYAVEIEKVEEEYAELVDTVGSEVESKAKDHLLCALTECVHSAGLVREDDNKLLAKPGHYMKGALGEKKGASFLDVAVSFLYDGIKQKILDIFCDPIGGNNAINWVQSDLETLFCQFEEQVEKCSLVASLLNELREIFGMDTTCAHTDLDHPNFSYGRNLVFIFKTSLRACRSVVEQLTKVILPDVLQYFVAFRSEDTFSSISQIQGSIDMALEQLIEVEIEKASLAEFEQNYFVKVGLITEQQLALEEASVKGRDHLSWEEAEELASQEEACKARLLQLHQTWNQKDTQTSSLIKREAALRHILVSSESFFRSLTNEEKDSDLHFSKSKALLSSIIRPFSELESIDKALSSFQDSASSFSTCISNLAMFMSSGCPASEYIWKFNGSLNDHSFFIWTVGVIDSFLDLCRHNLASCLDQNLGFDQLINVVRKKLKIKLQQQIGQYLRERISPILVVWLDKEIEHLNLGNGATKDIAIDRMKMDIGLVGRAHLMLEEFCNAHETARAARSAASIMKRQVGELKHSLCTTGSEIIQMEWMHDATLRVSDNSRVIYQKYLANSDNLYPIVLNLIRHKILESMRSAVPVLARSVEQLQACEQTSSVVEGQLERAIIWACGGPCPITSGNTPTKNSGIPPQFHDQLMRRRELLKDAQEKASDSIKICMSLLEFEASRDGIFQVLGDTYSGSGGDGRKWQQTYLNALQRLDASYHSFTRIEQEWKLAQSSMDAAAKDLLSATSEVRVASCKAKSASDDLHSTLLVMRDCAYEASAALSAFEHVKSNHCALTSECGSMLEEILAITNGIHDVHNLAKEAAAMHHLLLQDLSKANAVLLPLESSLSKDMIAITDALAREEREAKQEISPIHGQAIYQSYCFRIREACQIFKPLLPSLLSSVKGLHSLLTKLAKIASLHAGDLRKAFEELGGSQQIRSQELKFSGTDLDVDPAELDNQDRRFVSETYGSKAEDFPSMDEQYFQDKAWLSPSGSFYSSSSEGISSAELDSGSSFETLVEVRAASQEDSMPGKSESKHVQENDSKDADIGSETVETQKHLENLTLLHESSLEAKSESESELPLLDMVKIQEQKEKADTFGANAGKRITKGKNPFAVSVLRRVEMKIDGRDVAADREVSISEQVDYLLKQATSVDNLCNMYEGWTPWI